MPSREELWDSLQSNGAYVKDSMSRNVSMLLVGTGYGETKITHARKNGIYTCSLPMFDWLGLLEDLGESNLPKELQPIVSDLILNITFCCELLYGHSLGTGQRVARGKHHQLLLGRLHMLAAGLERLLQDAYGGRERGDNGETFEVTGESLFSSESIGTSSS
jgi:hypothetical protein